MWVAVAGLENKVNFGSEGKRQILVVSAKTALNSDVYFVVGCKRANADVVFVLDASGLLQFLRLTLLSSPANDVLNELLQCGDILCQNLTRAPR